MLKIYGSMLCPDCVECCNALTAAGVAYTFYDFAENLQSLKAFLAIRDHNELFDAARKEGSIGIPCIIDEKGNVTLDWGCYVGQAEA